MLRMRRFPWSTGDLPVVVFIWEEDVKTCVVLVLRWILLFLVAAVWHWRGRPAGIPSTWVALCELQVEGGNLSLEWILRSGARSSPEESLSKVSSSWCRISEVWSDEISDSYCLSFVVLYKVGFRYDIRQLSLFVRLLRGWILEGRFLLLRVFCVWNVSLIWIPALLCQIKTPGVWFYILPCSCWGLDWGKDIFYSNRCSIWVKLKVGWHLQKFPVQRLQGAGLFLAGPGGGCSIWGWTRSCSLVESVCDCGGQVLVQGPG